MTRHIKLFLEIYFLYFQNMTYEFLKMKSCEVRLKKAKLADYYNLPGMSNYSIIVKDLKKIKNT